MENVDLKPLVRDLQGNIDDLEEALAPLLKAALPESAAKLPLLDKAKLHVHITYAIESILFSFLRLNGINAREHPIFEELTRVKQYFAKIQEVENRGLKRENPSLDKKAAGRFIKHALAGNDEYDRKRAAQQAQEKAGARIKFEEMTERVGSHIRFEQMAKKRKADETGAMVRETKDETSSDSKTSSSSADDSRQPSKRVKSDRTRQQTESKDRGLITEQPKASGKEHQKRKKKQKQSLVEEQGARQGDPGQSDVVKEERILPSKHPDEMPKGHSEAFQALLQDPARKKKPSKKWRRSKEYHRRKEAGELA